MAISALLPVKKYLNSSPVFTAFYAVQGHFAYPVFIRQLLDGEVAAFADQYPLDGFHLVGVQLKANGAVGLHLFISDLCRAVLLVHDHLFERSPPQVSYRIVCFVVVDMNDIPVFG